MDCVDVASATISFRQRYADDHASERDDPYAVLIRLV
jgi:hypothetical protein